MVCDIMYSSFWIILFVHMIQASHFRGALFYWSHNSDGSFRVENLCVPGSTVYIVVSVICGTTDHATPIDVEFRISWRRSSSGHYCDTSTILSKNLVADSEDIKCIDRCTDTLGTLGYLCTDYSEEEDWTTGRNTIRYMPTTKQFSFGYSGAAWISLNAASGGSWSFKATVDLRPRSDTGKPNTSPTVDMAPVVKLRQGCQHTIIIPVSDVDGDVVRCRWASGDNECDDVCNSFPGSALDKSQCILTYSATDDTGYYAVALQIEDFMDESSDTPLCSIPIQFLVNVFEKSSSACSEKPKFIHPTPGEGSCNNAVIGETMQVTIKATSVQRLRSITTISAVGMLKSAEIPSQDSSAFYMSVNVTWMPSQNDAGKDHSLCFYASDEHGLVSDIRCIHLPVSAGRPKITNITRDGSTNTWEIRFDQKYLIPTESAVLKVYERQTGNKVHSIDVYKSAAVDFDPENRNMSITFNFTFQPAAKYYVLIPEGLVGRGTSCGSLSEAVVNDTFWEIENALIPESHFRGAQFFWSINNDGSINVEFRISWRRSSSGHYCDNSTISNNSLMTDSENITCIDGCNDTLGTMEYFCTDYNEKEDWTTGRNTIRYMPTTTQFSFGYSGAAWISLNGTTGGSWSLKATVDLRLRSDLGKSNTSPTVDMAPVVKLMQGCQHTIIIPVRDADGDVVRCRRASGTEECADVCMSFPGSSLNESQCILTYSANNDTGFYVVALQIEDFMNESSIIPLSSIPIQFLVDVIETSDSACSQNPKFVEPTPEDGSCYNAVIGEIMHVAIKATSTQRLRGITTISAVGMLKSTEIHSQDWSAFYLSVNVTWTPSQNDSGKDYSLCFYASDEHGLASDTKCIHAPVSAGRPKITNITREGSTHTWKLMFDQKYLIPTESAVLAMYDRETGNKVHIVDVYNSSEVYFDPENKTMTITFNFTFQPDAKYYVLLPEGVVGQRTYCGSLSEPVLNDTFWEIEIDFITQLVQESDFRGALFYWSPNTDGSIDVEFRISWRRSSSGHYCDNSTISNNSLVIDSENITCIDGCNDTLGTMEYLCTDYSEEEDWTTGRNTIKYMPTRTHFSFGYSGAAWISLNGTTGGIWSLKATVDLRLRSDLGKPNTSPTVDMAPVVKLMQGCQHTIIIPVRDADGDVVRCRRASGSEECADVCMSFPGSSLNESQCILTYSANNDTGFYVVALQIEDFMNESSIIPLSSIPIQFLVDVIETSGSACSQNPKFVEPTPEDGSCYNAVIGEIMHVAIKATSTQRLRGITTISAVGMLKSTEIHSQDWSAFYLSVNVTWTPSQNDSGKDYSLCFYASDEHGLVSDTKCIHAPVSAGRPKITNITREGSTNIWEIRFDQKYLIPTESAVLEIYERETGNKVHNVDVYNSSEVDFNPENKTMTITFNFTFETTAKYYVLIPEGVVRQSCGSLSEPVLNDTFWEIEDRIDCGCPRKIENGTIHATNGTFYPSVITYQCNEGFSLWGAKTRHCLEFGAWSECDPVCRSHETLMDFFMNTVRIAFNTMQSRKP